MEEEWSLTPPESSSSDEWSTTPPETTAVVEPSEGSLKKVADVTVESIKRNFLPQSGKVDQNLLDPIFGRSKAVAGDIYNNLKEQLMDTKSIKNFINKASDKPQIQYNQQVNDALTNVNPGLGMAHRIIGSVSQKELAKQGVSIGIDMAAGAVADAAIGVGSLQARIAQMNGSAERNLERKVVDEFRKAVRIKLPKNPNASDITKANSNIFSGIKNLFKNRDQVMNFTNEDGIVENRLPKNLYEVSQAVQNAKQLAYQNYSSLSKESQQFISGDEIGNFLRDELKDKIYQSPNFDGARRHIETLIKGYKGKKFDFSTSERIVSELVKGTFSGLKGSGEARLIAEVDGKLGKFLVEKIDDTVSKIPNQYSSFRNDYRVLRKLENDVTRAANSALPRSEVGHFGEYLQLFSVRDIVEGIGQTVSGNPGHGIRNVIKGLGAEALVRGVRAKNDPNRIIANAFSKYEEGLNQHVAETGMEQIYKSVKSFFNEEGKLKSNLLKPKEEVPSVISYINKANEKVYTKLQPGEFSVLKDEVKNIPKAARGESQIHLDAITERLKTSGSREVSRDEFIQGHSQASKIFNKLPRKAN